MKHCQYGGGGAAGAAGAAAGAGSAAEASDSGCLTLSWSSGSEDICQCGCVLHIGHLIDG